MKKITKAAIAGTVGAALLVGGAGSLAFWTDTATGPQIDIQSGQLDLGTVGTGTWTIQQSAAGVSPAQAAAVTFAPASDKIVPGDVLTTTVSVPVTLDGKNIKAKFDVAVKALVAGNATATAADTALITALNTGGVKVTKINGTAVAAGTTSANLTAGATVPVEISVTFPWGTAGEFNGAMLGKVKFQADYTLTQIPVATP
ncbi:alternate signal-mediated exported protein [Microterricola gilva]|uniref:Alternate signal-mediated exported protein n=1 Tax=Microterricola gilva TaxID=393267 RepID=A0A4Q8ASA5_9MICO|nr:alternate-type signal peptide domain-containing protein [Microterricola gilva]RZU67073.1 alternate signal-mediated exported protein [Microterricola gilva]